MLRTASALKRIGVRWAPQNAIIKGLAFLPCCTLIISHQVFQDVLLQEAAEPIAVTGKGGTAHT